MTQGRRVLCSAAQVHTQSCSGAGEDWLAAVGGQVAPPSRWRGRPHCGACASTQGLLLGRTGLPGAPAAWAERPAVWGERAVPVGTQRPAWGERPAGGQVPAQCAEVRRHVTCTGSGGTHVKAAGACKAPCGPGCPAVWEKHAIHVRTQRPAWGERPDGRSLHAPAASGISAPV